MAAGVAVILAALVGLLTMTAGNKEAPYVTKADLVEVVTPMRQQLSRIEQDVSALQQEAAVTKYERATRGTTH
jgi:hypothetical protein